MKRSSTAAQLLVAGCIGLGSFDVVAQDVALHATPSMDAFCRAANYTFPYYPEVWWDHNLTGANPNGGAREGLTGFWEYDRIEVPPYTDWRINRIEMVVQAYGGGDTPQAQQRAYDVALSSFLVSPPVRIYTGSATSPDLDAPRIYNQGAAGQPHRVSAAIITCSSNSTPGTTGLPGKWPGRLGCSAGMQKWRAGIGFIRLGR